jgi:TPR repeat protein
MFRLYRRSAELGNVNGMLYLSTAHSLGIGTTKDLKESHRWIERASNLGKASAIHLMAHEFENGEVVQIDKTKAFELMSLAFSKGDRYCTSCYASCFFEGIGTPKNDDKGLEILVNNSKTNASIQTDIAMRIREGRGVQKNAKVADDWERSAFETRLKGAKAGVLDEQEAVAECFLDGKGTAKDLKQAVHWFLQCAIQGKSSDNFSKACNELKSKNQLDILVDEMESITDSGSSFQMFRLSVLLQIPKRRGQLQNLLEKFYESASEQPTELNAIAWQVFELASTEEWRDESVISMSVDAAKLAASQLYGGAKASCLDTAAHLLDLQGNVTAAIKIQEEAVALVKNGSDENKETIVDFLDKLKAKKK